MRRHSGSARGVLALCAWLALATGCGPNEAPRATPLPADANRGPGFLRDDPRLSVAHAGVRRIEFPRVDGPGRSFRERITTDGQGHYSIEPVDALGVSGAEWESFALLQRAREGFVFRYRDFLVRDPRLFARNWRTTVQEQRVVVAGRSCALYRVERTEVAGGFFELSIDVENSLVLASRELDGEGQVVAAMTYEDVRLDPDLRGAVWHEPVNEERRLAAGDDELTQEIGARPLQPRLLPRGYGPLQVATVGDGRSKRWLMLTFSDGVEPLFFFQALDGGTEADALGAASAEAGLGRPTPPSSVIVFEVGAAVAIQGTVDGFGLMVIGKAPQAELLDLIESSLPERAR